MEDLFRDDARSVNDRKVLRIFPYSFYVFVGVGLSFILGGIYFILSSDRKSSLILTSGTTPEQISANQEILELIAVDVSGAVNSPGLYQLNRGMRVEDALDAAGGLNDSVDMALFEHMINRAMKLQDGMKIFVPLKDVLPAGVNSTGNRRDWISVNTSSIEELVLLEGIGDTTAQKIVKGRPYYTLQELTERKIVRQSVLDKLKDRLVL